MSITAKKCAQMLADSFPEGGTWSEQAIDTVLTRKGGHIFENSGGFLIAQAVLDEAEIWTILVQPTFRRQGYARKLINSALNALSKNAVTQVFLEVAVDNDPAISLYLSSGFTQTGRRKGYYRDAAGKPIDALVMRRAL